MGIMGIMGTLRLLLSALPKKLRVFHTTLSFNQFWRRRRFSISATSPQTPTTKKSHMIEGFLGRGVWRAAKHTYRM